MTDTTPGNASSSASDQPASTASTAGQAPTPTTSAGALSGSMTDSGKRHTSGSITRAIAKSMLAQEKDTRTFGRRGAIVAGALIIFSVMIPVILASMVDPKVTLTSVPGFGPPSEMYHSGALSMFTLTMLLVAGVVAIVVGIRSEGGIRAKGLFWTGIVAFLALVIGRPHASVQGIASMQSPVTLIFGLLGWSGMLVAARVRLTFDPSRTAQVLGAASAGLFMFVFIVTDSGLHLVEHLASTEFPWGTTLACIAALPPLLSMVNSEPSRFSGTLALLVWFVGLGLAIGLGVLFALARDGNLMRLVVTVQFTGVFVLLIVGSIDWIGQLLFRHRADAEAQRQLFKAVMAKAQS
ncbi:MAG: hypothetical protein AB7K09_23040 [Planctomycetota bacterium]